MQIISLHVSDPSNPIEVQNWLNANPSASIQGICTAKDFIYLIVNLSSSSGTSTTSSNKTSLDNAGSGYISGANLSVEAFTNGCASVIYTLSGNWNGTLALQGTIDGTNWFSIPGYCSSTGDFLTSILSDDTLIVSCGGYSKVRLVAASFNTLWSEIINSAIPTSASQPRGMCLGPDGNIWFTESTVDKIGKITPSGGIIEYNLTHLANPIDICSGPDGNLWFTENSLSNIGKITPAGIVTEYPVSGNPYGICLGPDNNLWYTNLSESAIGKISVTGTFSQVSTITASSQPKGICLGPNGNLWFTEYIGNNIGTITPSGVMSEYAIPTGVSGPIGICAGPDGNLWFTENSTSAVGKVTVSGVFTEYPTSAGPEDICLGSDGTLWFTENSSSQIGTITTYGTLVEYTIPTPASSPRGICLGSNNTIWFTEYDGNKIGRLVPSVATIVWNASSGTNNTSVLAALNFLPNDTK